MMAGFLLHIVVDYFQILWRVMKLLQHWLWTNMEGNEINTFT